MSYLRSLILGALALVATVAAATLISLEQRTHAPAAGVAITVDPGVTYQTMKGWEVTARLWETDKLLNRYDPSWEEYRDELFRRLVNELGITRVRIEIRSGAENPTDYWRQFIDGKIGYRRFRQHYYEKINDNDDPRVANATGFQFSALDYQVEKIVLPLAKLVEANGEKLYVNLTYVDFRDTSERGNLSHAQHPEEYAELIHAAFDHLRRRYGLTPDGVNIVLEPENTEHWRGREIGTAMIAAARRLRQSGFRPEFIAPSTTAAASAPVFFDELISIPGTAEVMSELSYHRYDHPPDAVLSEIARRASQFGLRTAMLEHVTGYAGALHADLTIANVSSWQQYAIARKLWFWQTDNGGYYYVVESPLIGKGTMKLSKLAAGLAPYFHFVRPGAVRIGTTSSSADCLPVAFRNANGLHVVVVQAGKPGPITVSGLPPAVFGVQYTSGTETARELPDVGIARGEALTVSAPARGTLVLHQRKR
jgi:hypothetical protein